MERLSKYFENEVLEARAHEVYHAATGRDGKEDFLKITVEVPESERFYFHYLDGVTVEIAVSGRKSLLTNVRDADRRLIPWRKRGR